MVLLAGSASLRGSMYFSKQGSRKKFLVTHSNVEDVSRSYYPGLVLFFCCSFLPSCYPRSNSYVLVTMETEWSAPGEGLRESSRWNMKGNVLYWPIELKMRWD